MFKLVEQEETAYLKYEPWEKLGCSAIFTLKMSNRPADSLRLYSSLNLDVDRVVQLKQVHSRNIFVLQDRNSYQQQGLFSGDALISAAGSNSLKGFPDEGKAWEETAVLQAVFADCVPVYFCEPRKKILALAHAGWRGTGQRISSAVLQELKLRYQVEAEDCQVVIGPAIGGESYQVGSEVYNFFSDYWENLEEFFKNSFRNCGEEKVMETGKFYLDLKEANRQDLLQAGVRDENIYLSPRDTFKDKSLFYSYRREGDQAKRMKALLFWKESKSGKRGLR